MIAYFPAPYEDELVYSVVSRLMIYSGFSTKQLTRELYLTNTLRPNVDFYNHFNNECLSLVRSHLSIEKNTMLPYYGRFCDNKRMYFENHRVGRSDLLPKFTRYLRYCPVCAKEDRAIYGETYWHCKHQIPEINICPKHYCYLLNTRIEVTNHSVSGFYPAEYYANDTEVTEVCSETEKAFVRYIDDIISSPIDKGQTVPVKKYFSSYLLSTKYVQNGHWRLLELLSDINSEIALLGNIPYLSLEQLRHLLLNSSLYPFDAILLAFCLGISSEELVRYNERTDLISLDDITIDMYQSGASFNTISAKLCISYDEVFSICMLKKAEDPIKFDIAAKKNPT